MVVDLFRIGAGKLAEHWDVLQNEVPVAAALGGISMFDPEEDREMPTNRSFATESDFRLYLCDLSQVSFRIESGFQAAVDYKTSIGFWSV